ncbi:hypothetical protein ACVWW5_003455 [Bradyrhizobium sp. LM3.4]
MDDRQPLGVRRDVFEGRAEFQVDIGMVGDCAGEGGLQVGAVHHPIGGAGARGGSFSQRHAQKFAAGPRAHDRDRLRGHGAQLEPFGEAELDQHAAGIGGELQTGADFLEPLGLFQHDDAEAAGRERKRSRQSTYAGTGNDNGSGERHP